MKRKRKQPEPIKPAELATPNAWHRYAPLAVCLFLALAVAAVFGQTVDHDFVNYDDQVYVYENPEVAQGLSAQGIGWAMNVGYAANWHPLTWLSHMADCQLYGLKPGGHHVTSVVLHAATAILLFWVLWQMTGQLWPSAFVAAVFAVHPLRVESVAWVAERKDVLSGFFFMLTLWVYLGYVRHSFSWPRYLTVLVVFALGLMAKPMLVTLPFVLLLLDYWPLGRVTFPLPKSDRFSKLLKLVVEKAPLFALSAGSCVLTSVAQTGALARLEALPLSTRVANAVVSYVAYLGQFFHPIDLSVFYPYPSGGLPDWKVAAALLVLTGISAGAVVCWRRFPCLLVGWLWYLGMLVPVIGVVQVGAQAMADRYTYLPQIGLCIALAWGVVGLTSAWPNRAWVLGITAALIILALMGMAWQQTTYWRDPPTLWARALQCNAANWVAHNDLGGYLSKHGHVDKAIEHFQATLEIQPDNVDAHVSLGAALASLGHLDEAIGHYQDALATDKNCAEAHFNLGVAWARQNRLDDAITQYEEALKSDPNLADAHANLGVALELCGRTDEALTHYRTALTLAVKQEGKAPLAEKLRAKLGQLSGSAADPR
jgi:protein O-mannosyl-transferase